MGSLDHAPFAQDFGVLLVGRAAEELAAPLITPVVLQPVVEVQVGHPRLPEPAQQSGDGFLEGPLPALPADFLLPDLVQVREGRVGGQPLHRQGQQEEAGVGRQDSGAGSTYVGGVIDIEALRDHRARAQWDNWLKDVRTELYGMLYEQPIYPKNLYLERAPYTHAEYREQVTRRQVELLQERGVWAPPARTASVTAPAD